jgi:hypothetical protein
LALDYLKSSPLIDHNQFNIFELFDFKDLYRIGFTLLSLVQKPLKRKLRELGFEGDKEAFLGDYAVSLLDGLFNSPIEFVSGKDDDPNKEVNSVEVYGNLESSCSVVLGLLPFADQFYQIFKTINDEGTLRDEFYLNYDLAQIDFESLLLSNLGNYALGRLGGSGALKKLGMSLEEFKSFAELMSGDAKGIISKFTAEFGLDKVHGANEYIYTLYERHLAGYDFSNLEEEEFKFVGGPLIFTPK